MFFNIGDNVFHCLMAEGTNDLSNTDVLLARVKSRFAILGCIEDFQQTLEKDHSDYQEPF